MIMVKLKFYYYYYSYALLEINVIYVLKVNMIYDRWRCLIYVVVYVADPTKLSCCCCFGRNKMCVLVVGLLLLYFRSGT